MKKIITILVIILLSAPAHSYCQQLGQIVRIGTCNYITVQTDVNRHGDHYKAEYAWSYIHAADCPNPIHRPQGVPVEKLINIKRKHHGK